MSGHTQHTDTSIYIDAIRSHVCAVCQTPGAHSFCGVSDAEICAIERFMPQIVEIATRQKGKSLDEHMTALREQICSVCRDNGDLHCTVRDAQLCSLDRYFVLIIEAIEQTHLSRRDTAA